MNDFTKGAMFAIALLVLGRCMYDAGRVDGRREERRKRKAKEIPIIVVTKSNEEES